MYTMQRKSYYRPRGLISRSYTVAVPARSGLQRNVELCSLHWLQYSTLSTGVYTVQSWIWALRSP
jgi:hypothetical protein